MNNLDSGPLDEATYQISQAWAFSFQTRRFFKFLPIYVYVKQVSILKACTFYFQTRRFSKFFHYMSLCKTSDTWNGAVFDPRAIFWTVFIKVHKMKLHTRYSRPGLSISRQAFSSFAYRSLCKRFDLSIKKGQGQPNVIDFLIFFLNFMSPYPHCFILSPGAIGTLVLEKQIFKVFLPCMGMVAILIMWPRCGKKLLFPWPMEVSYEIVLWYLALVGPVVSEEKSLKSVDCEWMDVWAYLYYKLTYKGSGELIRNTK